LVVAGIFVARIFFGAEIFGKSFGGSIWGFLGFLSVWDFWGFWARSLRACMA